MFSKIQTMFSHQILLLSIPIVLPIANPLSIIWDHQSCQSCAGQTDKLSCHKVTPWFTLLRLLFAVHRVFIFTVIYLHYIIISLCLCHLCFVLSYSRVLRKDRMWKIQRTKLLGIYRRSVFESFQDRYVNTAFIIVKSYE